MVPNDKNFLHYLCYFFFYFHFFFFFPFFLAPFEGGLIKEIKTWGLKQAQLTGGWGTAHNPNIGVFFFGEPRFQTSIHQSPPKTPLPNFKGPGTQKKPKAFLIVKIWGRLTPKKPFFFN